MNRNNWTDFVRQMSNRTDNGIGSKDLETLQSISRKLHRIDEDDCSNDYGEQEQERRTKRERKLEAEAAAIVEQYGAVIYHQSDPRGWPLYILFPGTVPSGERAEAYYNRGVSVPPA
jgi:hypothetical protein